MSMLKRANELLKSGNYAEAYSLYKRLSVDNSYDFLSFNLKYIENKYLVKNDVSKQKISNEEYEGRIESFEGKKLKGWIVDKKDLDKECEIDIIVDGVKYLRVKASGIRADLKRLGKSSKGQGGYLVDIPEDILSDEGVISVSCGNSLMSITYQNFCQPRIKSLSSVYCPIPDYVSISVIVPIYNAVEDVKVCVERLLKYTSPSVDIILINDASPDAAIKGLLSNYDKVSQIKICHNEKNLGFTGTVNKGIRIAKNKDVVLLNSDARVTPRWLDGLRKAVASDERIATVTPMSDRAGAFSAPKIGNDNDLPDNVSEVDYAVSFRRCSYGLYPVVPTGNGFCMYIRRKCIEEIGALDEKAFPKGYGEENDFCMRAIAYGWKNIVDDRTYVFHDRNKSFGTQKDDLIKAGRAVVDSRYPEYKKMTGVFSGELITKARFRATMALMNCKEYGVKPRVLYVISTLTGGTPQTNKDLMNGCKEFIEPWVLHCDSKNISLYKYNVDENDYGNPIEQHSLDEILEPITHISLEYDRIVREWIFKYDFEVVHIRHLVWHSLSLPKIAKMSGARVVYSMHDYYTVCPALKLIDNDVKYCRGYCSKTVGQCLPEVWPKDSFVDLKNNWVYRWRDRFSNALLKYCDAYVTTHESSRDTILQHIDIPKEKFHVINHGRDFKEFYQLADSYANGDKLKILVPGNISHAKGSRIINKILELDKKKEIVFHILGKSNIKSSNPNIIFHGEYNRDDFADHVRSIRPHIGAVFSIWNETWCHTLTEMWSVGLPVLSTNYETVGGRILSSGAGWVCPDDEDGIYDYIKEVVLPDLIRDRTRDKVIECQNELVNRNVRQMSNLYLQVYGMQRG